MIAQATAEQRGGVALQILGGAFLLLILVLGLGLAEYVRATAVKTVGMRALAAAVQSAALSPEPDMTFRQVLALNLPGIEHRAYLSEVAAGQRDPIAQEPYKTRMLVGALELEHRLDYLGQWLPAVRLRLTHAEPRPKRKPALP